MGVIITLSEIPGGTRFQVTPATGEGLIRMGGLVTKWTIESKRLTTELLVTSQMEMQGPLRDIANLIPLRIDKEPEKSQGKYLEEKEQEMIEGLFGVPSGQCHLI